MLPVKFLLLSVAAGVQAKWMEARVFYPVAKNSFALDEGIVANWNCMNFSRPRGVMKKIGFPFARIQAVVLLLLVLVPLPASAVIGTRYCTVKEVLKGGMYVYIRCQEGSSDLWLATVDRLMQKDDLIMFQDVPPMTGFYSKYLDRTFPEVILTDILRKGDRGYKLPAAP